MKNAPEFYPPRVVRENIRKAAKAAFPKAHPVMCETLRMWASDTSSDISGTYVGLNDGMRESVRMMIRGVQRTRRDAQRYRDQIVAQMTTTSHKKRKNRAHNLMNEWKWCLPNDFDGTKAIRQSRVEALDKALKPLYVPAREIIEMDGSETLSCIPVPLGFQEVVDRGMRFCRLSNGDYVLTCHMVEDPIPSLKKDGIDSYIVWGIHLHGGNDYRMERFRVLKKDQMVAAGPSSHKAMLLLKKLAAKQFIHTVKGVQNV